MKQEEFKGYITLAQVRKQLSINNSVVYNYVRTGTLHQWTPPGKKYALYKQEEVNQLLRERETFIALKDYHVAKFSQGTPDDMPETAKLIKAIFNTYPNVTRWITWIERNPEIFYIMRTSDQVVGCAFMMPLAKEK